MPRIAITEEQRRKQREEQFLSAVADGLLSYKHRNHMTNKELGAAIGLNHSTVASIMDAEPVRLNTDAFFRVLVASGIVLSKKGYRTDE